MSKKPKHSAKSHVPAPPPHPAHEGNLDELVVVPKGQSRLKFFLTVCLILFVLVIFTVGDQVESVLGGIFSGGGGTQVAMTWVNPENGEEQQMSYPDFYARKRALGRLARYGQFRSADSRDDPGRPNVSDEDTAMWIILDSVARAKGIAVTDSELKGRLRQVFGTGEVMRQAVADLRGTTPIEFEKDLRDLMRASKYRAFLEAGVGIADVSRVEELWGEGHPEYKFEYIQAPVENFKEAAAADEPTDEELMAWFRELPAFRQQKYHTEDELVVEVAWLPLDADFDATALLEKYPAPESEEEGDALEQARGYYNQFTNVRFRTAEPVSEDGSPPEGPENWYKPFEEVQAICEVEAPIHAALSAFLADVRDRVAEGTEVDFVAEATALGLSVDDSETPRTRTELEQVEGWGGRYISGQIAFGATEGSYLGRVVVEDDAMIVGKLVEKQEGVEPPIEDMREQLMTEWVDARAAELAVEALESLRDQMGERPEDDSVFLPTVDAETFAQTVEAAGYELKERPYLGRTELPDDDAVNATAGDLFIRQTNSVFELEEGQVAPAATDLARQAAVLVRFVDERPAPIDDITPRELAQLRQQAIMEARSSFDERFLDARSEFVEQRFALHLDSWDTPEGEEADL